MNLAKNLRKYFRRRFWVKYNVKSKALEEVVCRNNYMYFLIEIFKKRGFENEKIIIMDSVADIKHIDGCSFFRSSTSRGSSAALR